MGKIIWRTFNFFIWSSEIRYKSNLAILLRNDEARSGPFAAVFFQYSNGDKSIQVILKSFEMDNRNVKISYMVGLGLFLERYF